jgi:hypothetical protein
MNRTEIDPKTQARALALHKRLAQIDVTEIPVITMDRHIPRKQQALLARELFRRLGLKGISVTAPNYSMAQTVNVDPARRRDYVLDDHGMIKDHVTDSAAQANEAARTRLGAILLAAFPQHDNRSDSMTDHFDSKWSIG